MSDSKDFAEDYSSRNYYVPYSARSNIPNPPYQNNNNTKNLNNNNNNNNNTSS